MLLIKYFISISFQKVILDSSQQEVVVTQIKLEGRHTERKFTDSLNVESKVESQ